MDTGQNLIDICYKPVNNDRKGAIMLWITFLLAVFLIIFVSLLPFRPAANKINATSDPAAQKFAVTQQISPTEAVEKVFPQKQNVLLSSAAGSKKPVITIHREEVIEKIIFEEPKVNTQNTVEAKTEALTASKGRISGPSGEETWYNLNMGQVVAYMRDLGFDEETYPYWIREDGVKMFGNYVMIAAHLGIRPKGTIVQTSLGEGIVCDTGSFAEMNQTQIDIATNW